VRPEQSTSLPVCSTELLLNPSSPTQKLEYWALPEQVPVGSTQLAETFV
jgi:hypothetical protein